MTRERQPQEKELRHVCLLLIQKHDMLVVEPSESEKLQSNVVKALSYKFEHKDKADQALQDLNAKYKLSGIFNPAEKIEKIKTFDYEGKTFHVFQIIHRGGLQIEGNFRLVKIKDIVQKISIDIKGIGEYIVLPSLKLALN